MHYRSLVHVLSLFGFLTGSSFAGSPWPVVDLLNTDFAKSLESKTVKVGHDLVYKTPKQYQAYVLVEILEKLAVPESMNTDDLVVVFTAVDGYKVAMSYQDAHREAGYLAFEDHAAPNNEQWLPFKFGKQSITPGPFYLVWPKENLDEWRYPWPFQIASISLQPAGTYYGAAAPSAGDQEVTTGFNLFSRYCIRCHSINRSGGEVGPELNIPKNITEYFQERELPKFILNATAYRAGTKMPVFESLLSNGDAQAIVAYLQHMKSRKKN
jgi:mono/diheme cytochrome c family protein